MQKVFPMIKTPTGTKFKDEQIALEYVETLKASAKDEKILSSELIFKTYKKKRSLSANAYYWTVVNAMIAEHLDMDGQTLHYQFLLPVFGPDAIEKQNEKSFLFVDADGFSFDFETKGKGSSKMNSKEFWTFSEDIKKWAVLATNPDGVLKKESSGLGLYIPDPKGAMEYYEKYVHVIN